MLDTKTDSTHPISLSAELIIRCRIDMLDTPCVDSLHLAIGTVFQLKLRRIIKRSGREEINVFCSRLVSVQSLLGSHK